MNLDLSTDVYVDEETELRSRKFPVPSLNLPRNLRGS